MGFSDGILNVVQSRVTSAASRALSTAHGRKISSGYLVDKNKIPGGGGVLIFEADSYEEAMKLIQ